MEVTVLEKTEHPERLVCQAARGDYYGGYVGDTEYAELMKNVNFDESELPLDFTDDDLSYDNSSVVKAKTKDFIEKGVPKEDARGLLGLGTEVNLTVSGNARSFLHLLDMRRKADAQWSIREISEMMLDELFDWMPYTFNWYKKNGPNKLSP